MAQADRWTVGLTMSARRQQGIALVIVLWVVMLLSVMAASFAYTMHTENSLTIHALDRARGRALAEAAIAYAAYRLFVQRDPTHRWPADGTPRRWRFGSGTAEISVRDVSGLIDINKANPKLLQRLLMTAGGLNQDQAQAMVDRIEDFRDPDDLKRANGAERADYLQAGLGYGPKNAPFDSITELQQVMGMTVSLYASIEDAITVLSRQSGINPAYAPVAVLRAIPGVDKGTIANFVRQRVEHDRNDQAPPPLTVNSAYVSTVSGLAYDVNVVARPANALPTHVTAVISGRRRANEAFHVNAWREGGQSDHSSRATLK